MYTEQEQFERELTLEQDMVDRGKARYFNTVTRCKEKGIEATTSYGKTLLKQGIEPFSEAIKAFLDEAKSGSAGRRHKAIKMLEGVEPEVAAFIALRKVLDTFSKQARLQSLAVHVGREIELEKKLARLEEQDKERYNMTQNHIKNSKARKYRRAVLSFAFGKSETVSFEQWPEQDAFHLGHKLIELLVSSTGFFQIVTAPAVRAGTGIIYNVEPTPACREWMNTHMEHVAVMSPDYIPTIIPPKPWSGASDGGYHFRHEPALSLVKTRNVAYLRAIDERIQNGEMREVLTSVNALQDTAWAVNHRVLEVLEHLWERTEGDMAGLPPRDGYRLPPCPVCGADLTDSTAARVAHSCLDTLPEEEFKLWKKGAAMTRERNVSVFSRRLQIAKILHMAKRYQDEASFYFPYQVDFRGRIYAVPAYLNPQGTDFAKGLLQFAEGKPLGTMAAVKWLAIHGANTFGNDKVSLDERYSWVLENQERILAVAADPFSETWWHDVDSPFCFLAFCFEWAGYVQEGLSFVSHLAIAMDGTCNGLQIFSLLLRDKVGGTAVNLLPSERPNDIYRIVAEKTLDKVMKDATDTALDVMINTKKGTPLYNAYQCANVLKDLGINRKATKRQVMVLPYGGTTSSCREYTEVWLKEKVQEGKLTLPEGMSMYGLAQYLSVHIWDSIGSTVIAARDAMAFLQNMATVVNRVNKPIQWTTPCGLPVLQEYKDTSDYSLKTRIGDKIVRLNLAKESEEHTVNATKQRSAISPNYVHSLDAAALMKTVCLCLQKNMSSFAMIHDSYGTHAADSEGLAYYLRRTFIDMFGGDVNLLAMFQREVLAVVPMEEQNVLPALPNIGELDINEVENSAFFFA